MQILDTKTHVMEAQFEALKLQMNKIADGDGGKAYVTMRAADSATAQKTRKMAAASAAAAANGAFGSGPRTV